MTIPKNLQEKRDELAEKETEFCNCAGYTCSGCEENTRDLYKRAFSDCANLLLPEIEKMVEALKEISKNKYGLQGYVEENDLQGERDYLAKLAFGYEQAARETLQSWQRFTEGGE